MITLAQYFGTKINHPECTPSLCENAEYMLTKVNALLIHAAEQGAYLWPVDPDTGSCISGSRGGAGDGGFRLAGSKTGATNSKHKLARAVDIYDPQNALDNWLSTFDSEGGKRNSMLEEFGLFREAPSATAGWCHLQDLAPGSGRRTFIP